MPIREYIVDPSCLFTVSRREDSESHGLPKLLMTIGTVEMRMDIRWNYEDIIDNILVSCATHRFGEKDDNLLSFGQKCSSTSKTTLSSQAVAKIPRK